MDFKFEVGQRVALAELAPLIEAGTPATIQAHREFNGKPEYVVVLDDAAESTIEAWYYPEAELQAIDV